MTSRDKGILPQNYEFDKGTSSWEGIFCILVPIIYDGGGHMREVNGFFIFELGQIWQLVPIQEGIIGPSQLAIIISSINVLQQLIGQSANTINFPHTVEAATNLIAQLKKIIDIHDYYYTTQDRQNIVSGIFHFRTLLASELGKITTILLEDKRGYGVVPLWKNSSCLIADTVAPCLSVFVHQNIQDAAKCLVLDCWTAVGFHAMRSVEQVTRKYYELVTGNPHKYTDGSGKEREKGLGTLAQELIDKYTKLEQNKPSRLPSGNLGIVGPMIKGLCKLYRDPLSHPDILSLSDDQAITAFVQAIEVISQIVLDSHFVKPLGSVIF